jgi:hypothetical protein
MGKYAMHHCPIYDYERPGTIHWNAAFRGTARGSVGFGRPNWSSRLGDGSANGILVSIDCDLTKAWRSPTQWLRHKTGTGKTGDGRVSSSLLSFNPENLLLLLNDVCAQLDIVEINQLASHRCDLPSPTIRSVQD